MQILHRFLSHPGFLEVSGQLGCDSLAFLHLLLIQRFQRHPDCLVQVYPFHWVQAMVQMSLE